MQSLKGMFDALASSTITLANNIAKDSPIPAFAKAAYSRSGEAIKDGAAEALRGASTYTAAHPVAVGALLVGVGIAAASGLVAAPILGMAGFTSSGVAAGSAAAAVHSGIGNVVGGSVFATLQSAGAGGYGVVAVNTSTGAAILARSEEIWAAVFETNALEQENRHNSAGTSPGYSKRAAKHEAENQGMR